MTLFSAARQRLARAVERGDPRLGLVVGVLLSAAAAWAFAAPLNVARRAEDAVLDWAFQLRPPIRESERILMVDVLDQTVRQLGWPVTRAHYGQVVLALDRLGAKDIVFDVQFKTTAVRPEDFDPVTGSYVMRPDSRVLRHAIGASGKVTLAYDFVLEDSLSPELRRRFPGILEALRADFAATEAVLASRAGVDPALLAKESYNVKEEAAVALVAELLEKDPSLTFARARESLLPGDRAGSHPQELKILQFAYWTAKGTALLASKGARVKAEGRPPAARSVHAIVPPLFPFLERTRAAAPVNAVADEDGVLRRPWTALWHRGRPHLYLGLAGALGDGREVHLGADSLRLGGSPELRFPVDEGGRVLVDWAGNRRKKRGKEELPFAHLPFHALVGFFEDRYFHMDDNFRSFVAKASEDAGEPYHAEYVALGDRLRKVLAGELEMEPAEAGKIEAAMDGHRRAILADIAGDISGIEKALPAITAARARENSEKELRRLRDLHAALRLGYDREAQLRPLVEGKTCWIGSASTASGDLHSTPLGPTTPGIDALASVSNMVFTGQSIREAPRGLVAAWLLVLGVAVSFAVTHGRTSWAAAATLGIVAAALALHGGLFAWGSYLLSGAGPPGTAILVFAGVTAFKELVTERSRRKLEKELEKNTSPELVGILMEHPELLRQPRKMVGTFLFSDIKSFTSISEKMTPEVLVPFINRYLDLTTRSLKRHRAYLDKYIGDGIMALFGVPVASDDHARCACLAALDNQALLRELNEEFARDGLPRIKTRIGINSGEAIAGYVGAEERSDYTVLGDAVNLAARLEGANKEYETAIMASEFTQRLVASEFVFRELDRIRVVGKRNAVGIYEVVAPAGAPLPFPAGFLEAYAAALALFRARSWEESIAAFEKALALRPGDRPSGLYVDRARAFLSAPPPPDWEGVFELSSK